MALTAEQMTAAMSITQIMVLTLTVFRVWFRLHIRRFWWEDAFAAVAGVCCVAKLVASWILLHSKGTTSLVAFWITTINFPCVIWSARISILLSITRVARPTRWLFCLSLGFAILFSLVWTGSMVQRALKCRLNDKWRSVDSPSAPFCIIPYSISVYELATSCVADVILVVFSFRLLWNVNLPTRQRRMILIIFSSSIVTSLFSLFRATTNFTLPKFTTVSVTLEISISLVVCNLLVIVSYAYRRLNRKPDNPEDDDFTSPVPTVSTSQQLTTIAPSATSQQLTTITIELDTFVETSASGTRV